ncbi:RNA polymerase sigma factor [Solirubrobacter soli]|uniref:RNA polymerase sigma factor n=1 Tax=Solirubrobacter soli TaxID=363832 RepID=UPI000406155E|nr:sigma-70 family RNA polymerase sigma factor [Solirubrobacter soli]
MPSTKHRADASEDLPELVRRAAEGDQRAWRLLVRRFERLVLGVARRHGLGAAEADDVAQATWVRLFHSVGRIEDGARLGGWLATTAHHESLRVLRGNARYHLGDDDELHVLHHDTTLDDLIAAERDAGVRAAVARLSERDRALLELLTAEPPLSYAEIADRLGMPIGSIGPTRARCLERLRAATGLVPELTGLLP